MSAVTPPYDSISDIWGGGGPGNVIGAWCSGVLDTKRNRLVVWGGGHNDYYGNEVYAFDISTFTWHRLNDPSPIKDKNICGPYNPDSTPVSRHTYGGLAYIAHADRFFGLGGSQAGLMMTSMQDLSVSNCGTPPSHSHATVSQAKGLKFGKV